MAYDLALRRLTSRNWSRKEPATNPPSGSDRDGPRMIAVSCLGLLGLLVWSAPKAGRAWERRSYRRRFSKDDPRVTRKVPTVTMHNLVYGGRE